MFELHRVFLVSARMRKSNARETLVYAYPCHQPYSAPSTIGPRGTSWCVATSGVHAMPFLERFSSISGSTYGFSDIILLHRVFLMFELHRVFLVSASHSQPALQFGAYSLLLGHPPGSAP